jgi:hypothetical protein
MWKGTGHIKLFRGVQRPGALAPVNNIVQGQGRRIPNRDRVLAAQFYLDVFIR